MSQNQEAAGSVEEQLTGFRLRHLPSPFAFPTQMGDHGIVDIVALLGAAASSRFLVATGSPLQS